MSYLAAATRVVILSKSLLVPLSPKLNIEFVGVMGVDTLIYPSQITAPDGTMHDNEPPPVSELVSPPLEAKLHVAFPYRMMLTPDAAS